MNLRNDDESAEDAETDSHINFSNPIRKPREGVPGKVSVPPKGEPKWESKFKIELPEFNGNLNHEGLPSTSGATKLVPKATQSFTFKCNKCGEAGHKAPDCKKGGVNAQGKGKALLIEGCEDQEDEEFPMYEEAIVIGDSNEEEGLALVMKKTLLVSKQKE
nr:hypothetical protein CFP56_55333 [Quercus suber]